MLPEQGSIVVGTDRPARAAAHERRSVRGLGHRLADAFPVIEIPERDHYAEFLDAVLAGGKKPCSAGFDYAGPLTESVLIGNVAAHFPGETLKFDADALRFPDKPEADQHLTRTYREGWRIKT